MKFRIREATGDDSPQAAEVVRTVFEEYGFTWDGEDYARDLYHLQEHYLDRGHGFWVAEVTECHGEHPKGQIVGTCGLDLFEKLPGEPGTTVEHHGFVRAAGADCQLERLYVLPTIRRAGLGGALLDVAVERARAEGRKWMEIWSDKKLTLAHRLYEKRGARRIGERICHDPDQSPEWGMIWRF